MLTKTNFDNIPFVLYKSSTPNNNSNQENLLGPQWKVVTKLPALRLNRPVIPFEIDQKIHALNAEEILKREPHYWTPEKLRGLTCQQLESLKNRLQEEYKSEYMSRLHRDGLPATLEWIKQLCHFDMRNVCWHLAKLTETTESQFLPTQRETPTGAEPSQKTINTTCLPQLEFANPNNIIAAGQIDCEIDLDPKKMEEIFAQLSYEITQQIANPYAGKSAEEIIKFIQRILKTLESNEPSISNLGHNNKLNFLNTQLQLVEQLPHQETLQEVKKYLDKEIKHQIQTREMIVNIEKILSQLKLKCDISSPLELINAQIEYCNAALQNPSVLGNKNALTHLKVQLKKLTTDLSFLSANPYFTLNPNKAIEKIDRELIAIDTNGEVFSQKKSDIINQQLKHCNNEGKKVQQLVDRLYGKSISEHLSNRIQELEISLKQLKQLNKL